MPGGGIISVGECAEPPRLETGASFCVCVYFSETLRIKIIDVNDNPPKFLPTMETFGERAVCARKPQKSGCAITAPNGWVVVFGLARFLQGF